MDNTNKLEIDRMMSFLGPEGKSALSMLPELQKSKKDYLKKQDMLINKYYQQLVDSLVAYLTDLVDDKHKSFLKVPVFYKEEKHEPLIEYLVRATLKVNVNSYDEPYVLIGSSLCNVKVEDLIPAFGKDFKDIILNCWEIERDWKGVAQITCHDHSLNEYSMIGFSLNAAGFIHEKYNKGL